MVSAFAFGILVMVSPIDEIKEGDCLVLDDFQKLTGILDFDAYMPEDCGIEHQNYNEWINPSLQPGCSDRGRGYWARSVFEHDQPGVYWPDPVPCLASVTTLFLEDWKNEFKPNANQCSDDSVYLSRYRKESMKTKALVLGQGRLYLPDPLSILIVDYHWDEVLGEVVGGCHQLDAKTSSAGIGVFKVIWKESDCLENITKTCKEITIGASKDDAGNHCALIKKVKSCR